MSKGVISRLLSKVTAPAIRSENTGRSQVSTSDEVNQFLEKVSTMSAPATMGHLIFALDATASRQATWDAASRLQMQMFSEANSLGGLNLQLCYFRGFGDFYSSEWHSDAAKVMERMQGLSCQAGRTQIEAVLKHALAETTRKPLSGVIYIGDSLEEDVDTLADLAGKLGLLKVPIFAFQEGGDPVAHAGFKELARLSGGAYSRFDSTSAEQLRSLLRAVAVYAVGGVTALKALGRRDPSASDAVALIERQIHG